MEVTLRLRDLVVPAVPMEKKNKVVDLSKSRMKKNALKHRDVFSPRGTGLKHSAQTLSPNLCDLAEFVIDISYSLSIWIESSTNILSHLDGGTDLHFIASDGLSIHETCATIVSCIALLYEHTIPLLERAVAALPTNEKATDGRKRVTVITKISRELLIQTMKTLLVISSECLVTPDIPLHATMDNTSESGLFISWDDIIGKLLSTGISVESLVAKAEVSTAEDVLV